MKDLKKKAQEIQKYGRGGDTILAHINPQEAAMLKAAGGSGTINPDTGLPEFLKLSSVLGTVGGGIIGGMFGMPGLGASIGGALLGGDSGGGAYQQASGQQQQAGLAAAQAAAFRPVGITTRFGTSQFTTQTDPVTGLPITTGAQYTASPEIQALQNRLSALYGQSLTQAEMAPGFAAQFQPAAQGLFSLGQQFLPTTPTTQMSPEAAAYAAQLRGLSGQLLPTSFAPGIRPETQAFAERLYGAAGQLAPTSFAPGVSPEVAALNERLRATGQQLAPTTLAPGLGAEAQGYINQLNQLAGQITPTSYDTTAAARNFYEQQQAIMAPERQREEERLAASVFGRGRAGLNIGMMGQPELSSLAQARRQQDLQLGLASQERARAQLQQDIGLGTGLRGQAFAAGVSEQDRLRAQAMQNLGLSTQLESQGVYGNIAEQERLRQQAIQGLGLSTQLEAQGLGVTAAEQDRLRAQALQNLGLATGFGGQALSTQQQAEQFARQQMLQNLQTGTGLFGTAAGLLGTGYGLQTQALAPFQTQFGVQQALEQAALQPLELGAALGGRNVNTAGAQALLQSGLASAQSGLAGQLQQQASGQALLNQFVGGLGGTQALGQIGQRIGGSLFGTPYSGWGGTVEAPWYG